MNNDMKLYFAPDFRDEAANVDIMRNALNLILKEIERFRFECETGESNINGNDEHVDIFKNIKSYTMKINVKNRKLKKLKENLKIACDVARIVLSSKNRDKELLIQNLNVVRNESLDLVKSNAQNLSLIQQLQMENYSITNDMQLLSNFIHLGYEKLQIMRNETPKDIPFLVELKTILLACGQYYADYCNERERCALLEQRNRFLKNKLNILENTLAATHEELRNLRIQNTRLRVKCDQRRRTEEALSRNPTNANVSEIFVAQLLNKLHIPDDAPVQKTMPRKRELKISNKTLYIASHLETVRNLISDQDQILKELKELYHEVQTSNS